MKCTYFYNLECIEDFPPMLASHEVPINGEETKKLNLDWELAYPKVNFIFHEIKNDKTVLFKAQFDYDYMLEKFGIKKEKNENKNIDALVKAIEKFFNEKRVSIEPWQQRYYSLEFKGDEDKTIFKANLKDD